MKRAQYKILLLLVLPAALAVAGCSPSPDSKVPVVPKKGAAGSNATTPRSNVTTPYSSVTTPSPDKPAATPVDEEMVAIDIVLPAPAFRGTPVPLKEPNVEKPKGAPRGPFLAPKGTVNLALGKLVTASDPSPAAGESDYVTDGDKEASDFGYLELRPGVEWVQIDLGQESTIYAVLVWHSHADVRVYRDVVVQVSDDPDFLDGETVFNNDHDSTSGLGIGADRGYVETSEGKLINCRGVEGRYVRLYSQGSNIDSKNHYTEVEVYGKPK